MVPDDRGVPRVCTVCLGQRFRDITPDGPACDIETHVVIPQADGAP